MAEETRHRTINKMLGDQGRTKTWLAERTGFSYSYVTQVLRGEKPVTEEFVDKATRALGGRMVLEIIRGEAVMIPRSVFRREVSEETFEFAVEHAWKEAWIKEHGAEVLAAAAERAYRATLELEHATR